MGNNKPDTLCWSCKNAVPTKDGARGCAWADHFEPVKGWEATETTVYTEKKAPKTRSYIVHRCPEYTEG